MDHSEIHFHSFDAQTGAFSNETNELTEQRTSNVNNQLPLHRLYRTIQGENTYYCIAANDNYILGAQENKLYLFDHELLIQNEIPWIHNRLFDMFWSLRLTRFILITRQKIFTLDERTMNIQELLIAPRNIFWQCGTCFNDTLFLSTWNHAASIFKYTLPSMQLVKECQSPDSCQPDEFIHDLKSNNVVLALMIVNSRTQMRLDLCSPITLERLSFFQFGSISNLLTVRCCSLNDNQWFVINPNDREIFHVFTNEQSIMRAKSSSPTWHAIQSRQNALAFVMDKQINLYRSN